uniref:Uromodulin-like 1 n=1 Tax=Xenopus tropicalis TaxID=8364 RepID=A0A6I8PSU7_XENTR
MRNKITIDSLCPLNTTVHHISTKPEGIFAVKSQILIGVNELDSLPNISAKLNGIVTRIPEIISIHLEDINECLHMELHPCLPGELCTKENGSYQCSRPNTNEQIRPPLHMSHWTTETPPLASPEPGPKNLSSRLPPPPVSSNGTRPFCNCSVFKYLRISNVSSGGFDMDWSTDCPENQTYHVHVYAQNGFTSRREIRQTYTEIRGLMAGDLCMVNVSFMDCMGHVHWKEGRIKHDAQILNVTLKITNHNLTEALSNSSSGEYLDFVTKFVQETKQALSKDFAPAELMVEVESLRAGSIIVCFTVTVIDSLVPLNLSRLPVSFRSSSFVIDEKSVIIEDFNECSSPLDNDCHTSAQCINLYLSYTCQCLEGFTDIYLSRPGRNCVGMMGLVGPQLLNVTHSGRMNEPSPTNAADTSFQTSVTPGTSLYATTENMEANTSATFIPPGDTNTSHSVESYHIGNSTALIMEQPKGENVTNMAAALPAPVPTQNESNVSVWNTTTTTGDTTHTDTPHGSSQPPTDIPTSSNVTYGITPNRTTMGLPVASSTVPTGTTVSPLMPTTSTTMEMSQPPAVQVTAMQLKSASTLICDTGRIGIIIQRSYLRQKFIDESSLYLGNPECNVTQTNDTHVLLQAGWNECGTEEHSNKTNIMVNTSLYHNLLTYPNPTPRQLGTIRCVFSNDILASTGYTPSGGFLTIIEKLEGDGTFMPEFQLFSSDQPMSENLTFNATDNIKVQIRIKADDSQLKVVISDCWATPSLSSDDPISFPFIKQSCAVKETYTVIHTNGISNNATFETKLFSFVGDHSVVYIHCRLHVCKESEGSSCKPTCGAVSARSSSPNIFTGLTRLGPIHQSPRAHKEETPEKPQLGPGYITLIIVAVLAFVASLAAIFICWHERRTGKYNFTFKCQDVGYQVFSN